MTTNQTNDPNTARDDHPGDDKDDVHGEAGPERFSPHTGRVVAITGAAGGIGSLLVHRFLANGDTVLATDVSPEALDTLQAEAGNATTTDDDATPPASAQSAGPGGLSRPGERLRTLAGDITDAKSVEQVANLAADLGGVDVLINCAGWFPITPFAETDEDLWRKITDINLTGPFLITHALLPQLTAKGWGRIINFGSGSVHVGVPGQVHYSTAKAGAIGFTRSLARELGESNVTVNLLTPGLTLTAAVKELFGDEVQRAQRDNRALKRDQHPEDLVGPVFFLASPDADFITGQTLNVDGGMSMI